MNPNLPDESLYRLQDDACAFLQGNPRTAFVPFSTFRELVIQSAMDEALAAWKIRVEGKVGIACLIMMPSARLQDPNVPGPQFAVEIIVRTFEDPTVNNTHCHAEGVAIENYRWMAGLLIEDLTELYGDHNDEAVRPNHNYPGLHVYDSVFKGYLPQDYVGRTISPTIDIGVGDQVTLACSDPAAGIYYTIDGRMPMPPYESIQAGNPLGLYAGPFPGAVGMLVRAIAWNQTMLPSHVAKACITA